MNAKLVCGFILFSNVVLCIDNSEPYQNENRNPRARLPLFGNIFGSTTVKPVSSTSGSGLGFWGFYESSTISSDQKKQPALITPVTLQNVTVTESNSSIYQTKDQLGYVNYASDNGNKGLTSYGTNSNYYNVQDPTGSAVVYTTQNGTDGQTITNSYQSENTYGSGSGNQQTDIYENSKLPAQANDFHSSLKTVTSVSQGDSKIVKVGGSGMEGQTITNLQQSETAYGIVSGSQGSNSNTYQTKDQVGYVAFGDSPVENINKGSTSYGTQSNYNNMQDPSGSSVVYIIQNDTEGQTITNLHQSKNSYDSDLRNQEGIIYVTEYENNKFPAQANDLHLSTMISDQPGVSKIVKVGDNSNTLNGVKYDVASIDKQNFDRLTTNVFLSDKQVSATNLNKYANDKLKDSALSSSSLYLPNALSITNVQESVSLSIDPQTSNMVIVVCTDPSTGSVIGKYESATNLEEYKEAVTEKDGSTEWATISNNATSLTLPPQIILRNISMTIRGKIHYCQIINVGENALLQESGGTKISQTESSDANSTGNVPSRINESSFMDVIKKPIISAITAGASLVSNLFFETNNKAQLDSDKLKNVTDSSNNNQYSSVLIMSNANPPMDSFAESTSENSDTKVETDLKETSMLYESHLIPSVSSQIQVTVTEKEPTKSVTTDNKQDLFLSHHIQTNKDQLFLSHGGKNKPEKGSNEELHISKFYENKHSDEGNFHDKIFYSKYHTSHDKTPIYSMHPYHHSIEDKSKYSDSSDDKVFLSKPIHLIKDKEDSNDEDYEEDEEDGEGENDNDSDDISSDFEKVNKEAKYPVFSFLI